MGEGSAAEGDPGKAIRSISDLGRDGGTEVCQRGGGIGLKEGPLCPFRGGSGEFSYVDTIVFDQNQRKKVAFN